MDSSSVESDNNFNDLDQEDVSRHHRVSLTLQNMDWDDLKNIIYHLDVAPMDQATRQMMSQTKQILLSIRQQLKKHNIILRLSYKGDSYQMFKTNYFQQLSASYIADKETYCLVQKLTGQNPETLTQQCLMAIVHRVETTLSDLNRAGYLNSVQYTRLMSNRSVIQMHYLYFVPDQSEVGSVMNFFSI